MNIGGILLRFLRVLRVVLVFNGLRCVCGAFRLRVVAFRRVIVGCPAKETHKHATDTQTGIPDLHLKSEGNAGNARNAARHCGIHTFTARLRHVV